MFPPEPQGNLSDQPAARLGQDWSHAEIALIFFLYLLPIAITFHGLIHLPGLALAYLVLNVWICQKMLYKACTRCEHYGRRCPTLGGKAVLLLWSQREGKCEEKDLKLIGTLWIVMALVPIAALALAHRYYHLAGAVISIALLHLARTRIGCRKCRMREECRIARMNLPAARPRGI